MNHVGYGGSVVVRVVPSAACRWPPGGVLYNTTIQLYTARLCPYGLAQAPPAPIRSWGRRHCRGIRLICPYVPLPLRGRHQIGDVVAIGDS